MRVGVSMPADAKERWPGLFASTCVCALDGCENEFRKKAFTGRLFCSEICQMKAKRLRAQRWYQNKKKKEQEKR